MDHSALLPSEKPHYTHHVIRVMLRIVVGAAIGYTILTIGYIVGRWNGPVAQRIAHWVPTPMGWYRGQPIWQRDVLTMTVGMRTYADRARTSNGQLSVPAGNPETIGFNTLLRTMATRAYLRDHQIEVTDADVAQAFTATISQAGSADTVAQRVQQLYSWTPSQYRSYVTTADVLRAHVREYVVANEKTSAAQRTQANEVLSLIRDKKMKFSDAAKKYSEDTYGATGGDMGFVSRGEMTQEIEDVAFRLPLNTVSDVVVSPYGFHILQISEQRQQDGALQVHLWQLFIAGPNVDQIISAELKQRHPWIWEAGLRWDATEGRVVER